MHPATILIPVVVATSLAAGTLRAETAADARGMELFEKQVRPILVERCQGCHGAQKQRAGLRLDSRAWLLKGGESGEVVVPGRPEASLLLRAIRQEGALKMPPTGKLPPQTVEAITEWVRLGAPWPEDGGTASGPVSIGEIRRQHWAFRPVAKPPVPGVKDPSWVRTPVDAFVLSGLEKAGRKPAPRADRPTLIRRLSLDLIGLPPTPEEVQAFEADASADAWERVVDRLLASPRYGERWGRHWLDVARYADTKGYVFQEERRYPFAYTYRDYVIRSFNDDRPYDRFILEQLAADLLPDAPPRALAGLGFLTLGRRFLNNRHDIIDDRIDVTMRGLQALTVGCARCHDHKFDPIPQADYYSLYGVFASCTEPAELPLIAEPNETDEYRAFDAELRKRQRAVEEFEKKHGAEAKSNRALRNQLRALQKKVEEWKVTSPASPPRAMVLADMPGAFNPYVFLRGNPARRGKPVPRQYLEVVAGSDRQPFQKGSGRLELARSIASKDNPLTARVLVNRVWGWHTGQGLVRTPSDFGVRSEPPTHPELLDWLAADFMGHGWSIKHLHRRIVLSGTYQQASAAESAADPDNRLLGRMNRRRLELEPLRDSFLAVAGRLDGRMGGRSVDILGSPFSGRRTVYGHIDRQNLPGFFRTFDLASPDSSSPQRFTTTVPQQALFLMNSPFVIEQARAFAARPDVASQPGPGARIRRMYWLAFGRPASPEELAAGLGFVDRARPEGTVAGLLRGKAMSAWEKYAQVLLLSNEMAFVD